MRILLVEPHEATAQSLELHLRSEGWSVNVTAEGEDAAEQGLIYDYDMILTDLDLPDMHGFDVIRRLRAAKNRTPVMVLSGDSDLANRIKALNLGADDFLMKPFHKDELVARIHAIVRRCQGHAKAVIEVDGLAVDLENKTVKLDGRDIGLSRSEYAMLEVMAMRVGKVLTKEMFLNHLYGGRDEPEIKIIDVFMCKLRRKLGDRADLVRTIWGRGYMLAARDVMMAA